MASEDYELIYKNNDVIVQIKSIQIYEAINRYGFSKLFKQLSLEDKNITLDFNNVKAVDSLFMGELIHLSNNLKKKKKQFDIVNLSKDLKEFFDQIRLFEFLGINIDLDKKE